MTWTRADELPPAVGLDPEADALMDIVRRHFPICRSLTGEGLRTTLRMIGERVPLQHRRLKSGTPVFDWTAPDEWNVRGGTIATTDGRILVDFERNNLHVVGYSLPVDRVMSKAELSAHVHTLPDQPDLVPYRTAYFAATWGFCLSHRQWTEMPETTYRVRIDSTLAPGWVDFGEVFLPGESDGEFLLSVHCCHPSLANDNLSGLAVAQRVIERRIRSERRHRLGLRVLFVPATIGSLAWLMLNEDRLSRIEAGLVLTCLGDAGGFHYKRSRQGRAAIDRAVEAALRERGEGVEMLPFTPFGYDERQYCSPGFDLPVGCLMRSPNGTFPEYHTSADTPEFLDPTALRRSLEVVEAVVDAIDADVVYRRVDGRGEPQLGRRGLYKRIAGDTGVGGLSQEALIWLLNLADGRHTLLDISHVSGIGPGALAAAANVARSAGLITLEPDEDSDAPAPRERTPVT